MSEPSLKSGDEGFEAERLRLPKAVTVSIVGSFLLLLMGAVYYARSFVLPRRQTSVDSCICL